MQRLDIPYLDGVNMLVEDNVAKRVELEYCENARSEKIGSLEKRKGYSAVGNDISALSNYGLFYFESSTLTNKNLYRISDVGGVASIYYLNTSDVWTSLAGFGSGLYLLGDSTTQFDITNTSGTTYRYTFDGTGTAPLFLYKISVGTILTINAQGFSAVNNGTFTVTAIGSDYFEVTNATGTAESNKLIGTGYILVKTAKADSTIAEGNLFIVNGINDNRYITNDGSTVVTSINTAGHLYGSPIAKKINYYKDKLYLADYYVNGVKFPTSIMFSSVPLGIVCLSDGDFAAGVTTINVTDTKYVHTVDSLDVYRGDVFITTLIVTNKTEYALTVNATGAAIMSSDELWVSGSKYGERVYRWASPTSGSTVKRYDTFKLPGGNNSKITLLENIGDVMVIGNKNNISTWNGYNLTSFASNVGCVSEKGFTSLNNILFFVGYNGIYATTGAAPKLMSSKVAPIFWGATKTGLENACVGKKDTSIFVCIGDSTIYNNDGSVRKVLKDVCIEYNIVQENFFIHTNVPAEKFETYVESINADQPVFTHSTNFKVFKWLNGYDDNGSEIAISINTNKILMNTQFEMIGYPKKALVEILQGNSGKLFLAMDDDKFEELPDSVSKGCSVVPTSLAIDKTLRGRKFRLAIRETSKRPFKISRMAIIFDDTNESEVQRS